jgi:putative Mg2+ transporter-C (MgtC) family protein
MNKTPSVMRVNASMTNMLGGSGHRHAPRHKFRYFTEFTLTKGLLYGTVLAYVLAVCIVVLLETVLDDEQLHCNERAALDSSLTNVLWTNHTEYANTAFRYDPCRYVRFARLLWLTREECAFGRSLVASVLMGGIVGWERRQADRPAGIRTMALVSLGACLFSINSTFAFRNGPMGWDASRVSAAIPSGVGFLGAGLIFKQADKDQATGDTTHVVHGLTTSASLWIVRVALHTRETARLWCSAASTRWRVIGFSRLTSFASYHSRRQWEWLVRENCTFPPPFR